MISMKLLVFLLVCRIETVVLVASPESDDRRSPLDLGSRAGAVFTAYANFSRHMHRMLSNEGLVLENSFNPQLVIGIVSARRKYPSKMENGSIVEIKLHWSENYLSATVATLLQQMTAAQTSTMAPETAVFICQTDPSITQFVQPWKPFVHVILKSSSADSSDNYEKEKDDYVFCMSVAHHTWPNSTAIILLEDDAVPAQDFFEVAALLLHDLQYPTRMYEDTQSPAYIKMYHPTRLRGTTWSIHTFCLSYLLVFIIRLRFKLAFCWLCCLFISCLVLGYIVGHGTVSLLVDKLRSCLLLNQPYIGVSESGFTQAVLYPSKHVKKVIELLRNETCREGYAKDHVLDLLPYSSGLSSRMTIRNYVKHIGLFGSVHYMTNDYEMLDIL